MPSEAAYVACGPSQVFVISHAGGLLGWGQNNGGQLGLGHNQMQKLPQAIPLPNGFGALRVAGVSSSMYDCACVIAVLE